MSIESVNIALTALDLLGDSRGGMSTRLEPKIGWMHRGWCTINENVVLEGFFHGDAEKVSLDYDLEPDCKAKPERFHTNTHSLESKNCTLTLRHYTTLQCNEIITKAFNPANSNKFMVLKGGLPHVTVTGGSPNNLLRGSKIDRRRK